MRAFFSRPALFAVFLPVLCVLPVGCSGPGASAPAAAGIVSLAPNLTETVYALGAGPQVLAVGKFDDWPPEVLAKPKAGGYLDPDLEKITLLNPALIIVPGQHPKVTEFAKLRGLRVLNVNMDSFATIDAGIRTIGAAVAAEAAAEELVARLDGQRAAVAAAVAGLPRPKVLLITQRQSHDLDTLYSAGGPSFVSEITALAGGENIFADQPQNYFEASKESVVLRAPDVIVEFHCGEKLDDAALAQYRADWQALATLPAVQQGRIEMILEPHGLRPGPRIIEIARRLAEALHPGVQIR